MTFIVCVDDQNGVMFGKRRQSRDRAVTARILALCEGKRLWMSTYSASLFEGADVIVDDRFAENMGVDDAAFIESGTLPTDNAATLIVYRWNRRYPADTYLPIPEEHGFIKSASTEFAGYSHECITEDIYEKRGITHEVAW